MQRYLTAGGMLLADACCGRMAFDRAFRREIRKALPDTEAAKIGYIRVLDESGEDYIYPASWFGEVDFDENTRNALTEAA